MEPHWYFAVFQEQMKVKFPQRVFPLRWLPHRQVHVALGDASNRLFGFGFVKHCFDGLRDANSFISLHQSQDVLSVGLGFPLAVQYLSLPKQRAECAVRSALKASCLKGCLDAHHSLGDLSVGLNTV